jgi:hypothetical protein
MQSEHSRELGGVNSKSPLSVRDAERRPDLIARQTVVRNLPVSAAASGVRIFATLQNVSIEGILAQIFS